MEKVDKNGSTVKNVRFVSMLNGDCFENVYLTEYDYAGFTVSIGGDIFEITTYEGNTSFSAAGKEIKIDDYSRQNDFFFMKNTTFGKSISQEITVTPFVVLTDGKTTISGQKVSFTLGELK